MKRLLRRLAGLRGLHFALLGAMLFTLRALLPGAPGEERPVVSIGAERVEQLAAFFERSLGRSPDGAELRSLVEQEIEEILLEREARRLRLDFGDRSIEQRLVIKMRAIATDLTLSEQELYRQALALGLDDDQVVSRQLREKMRLYLQQDGRAPAFSEADFEAALERHRERFQQPATLSFTQIFVSAEMKGAGAAVRAHALREEIVSRGLAVEAAQSLGDPFPLAARWNSSSQAKIAKAFGAAFAAEVASLEPRRWSQPIASPYGRHLVFVHERSEGGPPTVEEVREQLLPLLEEERAARRLQEGLQDLRKLYEVEVEWPATRVAEMQAFE